MSDYYPFIEVNVIPIRRILGYLNSCAGLDWIPIRLLEIDLTHHQLLERFKQYKFPRKRSVKKFCRNPSETSRSTF